MWANVDAAWNTDLIIKGKQKHRKTAKERERECKI